MAFCCSSVSSNAKPAGAGGAEKTHRYKAAAEAAVDISNLIVKPGSKVPAFSTSLFSHSRVPTTRPPRDLAGNRMPQSPTPDKDYYEKLSGMSPAAPAPPACVREHPSVAGSEDGKSVATSWISGRSTPRSDRELHPSPTAAEVAALYSWKREVAEWKRDIENCLRDLTDAIRNEDIQRAKKLMAMRDELIVKPIPEPPAIGSKTEESWSWMMRAAKMLKLLQQGFSDEQIVKHDTMLEYHLSLTHVSRFRQLSGVALPEPAISAEQRTCGQQLDLLDDGVDI